MSIVGQWETEILGRNYLLEFLDDGTLRCYEEDASQSDSGSHVYQTEPCDVITYEINGNDLSLNLKMILYPDGNSISVWRRYDGNYVMSLNSHTEKASLGTDEIPNANYPSSLSFSGKAPNSSFAGYSSEVPGSSGW